MTSISSVFSKRPKSWGYRGDPYFWDALGWEFSSRLAQSNQGASADVDYEALLLETYRQLAADGDQRGDGIALAWLPLGGMSGGLISSKKWRGELLPALADRVRSIPRSVDLTLDYHPAEHRFRFSAWAASTAARSSRKVCTFPVSAGALLLRESALRWMALGSHWLPRSREAFDHAHHGWCEAILRKGRAEISPAFTYGISAKLVNCYLKALFLQTMVGLPFDPHGERSEIDGPPASRFLHPPIDRVLMEAAAKRSDRAMRSRWKALIAIGWSKFSHEDYAEAMALCAQMVGDDVAKAEVFWSGFQ